MAITFNNQAAQGDVLFRRIDKLPKDVIKGAAKNGQFVVAHSETLHNHVVRERPGVEYYLHANDNNIAYLVVNNEAEVEHMRSFHTHETIKFSPGIYEIRRQIEDSPEGLRPVID